MPGYFRVAALITLLTKAPAVAAPLAIDESHARVTLEFDQFGFSTTHGLFRIATDSIDTQ